MTKRFKEGILPFKIAPCNEPLVARSGLLLPYEMAKALRLPRVIDEELPGPGSGRGYKPSQFVLSLILMFHGGGKKLEDLRELKDEMSLRELLDMESLPASCTIGCIGSVVFGQTDGSKMLQLSSVLVKSLPPLSLRPLVHSASFLVLGAGV
jgi:hypothetical protein